MPDRVQFTLRLEKDLYDVIKAAALAAGVSIQDAIARTLKGGIATADALDRAVPRVAAMGRKVAEIHGMADWANTNLPNAALLRDAPKMTRLLSLFVGYVSAMPAEKVEVLTKAMEWDLRTARSARLKATRVEKTKSKSTKEAANEKPTKKARKR